MKKKKKSFEYLFFFSLFSSHLLSIYVETISRRIMNISYVIGVIGFNLFVISFFILFDFLTCKSPSNTLLSFNKNQLFCFLFANICTGVVNLSIKTIYSSNFVALIILFSYLFVVSLASFLLDSYNISLKWW